jgi:hypothetical protein
VAVPWQFPHSPMVCVKLPKSVLVLFHSYEVSNFSKLKGKRIDHIDSRLLLALVVRCFALDKAASYRRMSNSDSA